MSRQAIQTEHAPASVSYSQAVVAGRAFPNPPPARSAPVVSGFPILEALISIEAIAMRPG